MLKNKKFLIWLLAAVVLFLIVVLAYFNATKKTVVNNKQVPSEEDQLKKDNNKAINQKTGQVSQLRAIDETDHIWGDKNAPVQIIIYSDFECPFCARFADTLNQIKQEFADKVAIAFRHFPLSFHPEAMPAAEASECAAEQGKFWEMHDKIFADNKAGNLNVNQFKKDASDLGLNKTRFNQCFDTDKYKEKVLSQMLEGKNLSITGTPTIFVNGEVIAGAYPMDDFTASDGRPMQGMRNIIQKYIK